MFDVLKQLHTSGKRISLWYLLIRYRKWTKRLKHKHEGVRQTTCFNVIYRQLVWIWGFLGSLQSASLHACLANISAPLCWLSLGNSLQNEPPPLAQEYQRHLLCGASFLSKGTKRRQAGELLHRLVDSRASGFPENVYLWCLTGYAGHEVPRC